MSRPVTFWLATLSILSVSPVARAEYVHTAGLSDLDTNQTLLHADQMLISPAEKAFAFDVDLSYNSNFLGANDADYAAESFVALSSRYQISSNLSLSAQIGVLKKNNDSADLADTKLQLTYDTNPNLSSLELKYNLFSYLPTSSDDRSETGYEGGVGVGVDLVKKFTMPGLRLPGHFAYGFSMLKNFYASDVDWLQRSNMSYRLRHSFRFHQRLSKRFSFQLSSFLQTGVGFDGHQRSFFQISEIVNYQSSKNLSFYVGHTNEADALENNGIDTDFNTYDVNENYFVSGAKISF